MLAGCCGLGISQGRSCSPPWSAICALNIRQFDGCRFIWVLVKIQSWKLVVFFGMKPFKSWWGPVLPHSYRNQGVASWVCVKFFYLEPDHWILFFEYLPLFIWEWSRSNYIPSHMWRVPFQTEASHIISTNHGTDANFCGCDWCLLFGYVWTAFM